MDPKNPKSENLKVFFIKLISITIAAIISINVLFNLIIADKIKHLEPLFSLTELENRKYYRDKIREDLIWPVAIRTNPYFFRRSGRSSSVPMMGYPKFSFPFT